MVASVASLAYAQQDSLPEKYTKKVLIEAKWGNGPGEFQLGALEAIEYRYTSSLTISEEGLIFIKNGGAVNVFNQDGLYLYSIKIATKRYRNPGAMAVDSRKGFLYVRCYDAENQGPSILVVNINKKENVTSYTIPNGVGAIYFYNDMKGHIFVWSRPALGWYKAGTVEKFLPIELFAEEVKKGTDFLSKAVAEDSNGVFIQRLITGENIKFKSIPQTISSERNNIRALLTVGDVFYADLYNGNVRCKINLEDESWDKVDMARMDNIAFDKDLNCYQVIGRKEGLKVIKYTPSLE